MSHAQRDWVARIRNHPQFRLHEEDLSRSDNLETIFDGADVVWHLAANTDMVVGAKSPQLDVENGFIATFRLLECLRRVGPCKLVFASSGAVYGDIHRPPASEEYGPMLPVSLYGANKLGAEALMSAYYHVFGIRSWMFRFGNVLGERMSHGVIFDFIRKLRERPTLLEILGDGTAEKNYILVEEIIDGMLYALDHVDACCEIFNLGSPTTTTVKEIAKIVVEELALSNVDMYYTGGSRGWPGDQPRVYMDVGKMRSLGWTSKYTSTEAVRIATRRYLGHEASPQPPSVGASGNEQR
jgi:UDP-glucose 4-epimerase